MKVIKIICNQCNKVFNVYSKKVKQNHSIDNCKHHNKKTKSYKNYKLTK